MVVPIPVSGRETERDARGAGAPQSLVGDTEAEYRAVRGAAGVAMRDDLAYLVLSGRDPVRMVQGLITNDLASAPDGRAVYAAMLTPKGRTIAELRAWKEAGAQGVEVHLELPREVLAGATDHLRRSVPPLYARWRDASTELGSLGVYGPRAHELLVAVLSSPVPLLEEDDLVASFGADYLRYRQEVRCWWPRRTAYLTALPAAA